jgi:hypothetical protein
MNKPGSRKLSLVGLREAPVDFLRLERDQRVPGALGARTPMPVVFVCVQIHLEELRSEYKGGAMTYCINSSRRLCSATSPGYESKHSSNAITRGRRILILLATAMDP